MSPIDFHAHLAPTPEALEILLASMRETGIERAVVVAGRVVTPSQLSHHLATGEGEEVGRDIPVNNALIAELCRTTGGKLLPFYFANPLGSTAEYEERGHQFYGLKLAAVVHGVPLNDRRNRKFLELAQQYRHPVYLHLLPRPGFDADALKRLASHFPELPIVMGHGGVNTCDFHAVDAIAPHPNLYFETSGPFSSVVSYAAKTLGIDRILFGTEHPLQSARVELEKLRVCALPVAQLNRNALRLLGERVAAHG